MCELYACSAAEPYFPRTDLETFQRHGQKEPWGNTDGWGVSRFLDGAWQTDKQPEAALTAPAYSHILSSAQDASVWVGHLREASQGGPSFDNTQPIQSALNQTELIYAHNGAFEGIERHAECRNRLSERKGSTDSECAQIILRHRLIDNGAADSFEVFRAFCADMRAIGPSNFIIGLNDTLLVHADVRKPVNKTTLQPPGLYISTDDHRVRFASEPLDDDWVPLERGACLLVANGRVVLRSDLPI